MTLFAAVNWNQVIETAQAQLTLFGTLAMQFLDSHQVALIAPALWILLATMFLLHWLPRVNLFHQSRIPMTPSLVDNVVLSIAAIARFLVERMPLTLEAFAHTDCTADTLLTCNPWDTTFEAIQQP